VDLGVGFRKARSLKISIKILRLRANKGTTVLSKLRARITTQSAALQKLQRRKKGQKFLFLTIAGFQLQQPFGVRSSLKRDNNYI